MSIVVRSCWLGIFLALCSHARTATEVPLDPLLRVETDMHTAFIKKLSVDYRHRRVVSASDDKSARVWDLKTGRLLNVLRVPTGLYGHEGQLYAAAVSPDGRTVAVAGYTGWDWGGNAAIYFFDIESGLLAHRLQLSNAPTVVDNLAYSDGGRYLAVCLSDRYGLVVFETGHYTVVARDSDYKEKILGIDFSRTGQLVTSSVDGIVRLYDRTFTRIQKRHIGNEPFHAYFSPDGDEIAVGFNDVPRVVILSAQDLSERYTPDVTDLTGQKNLIAVNWSRRGDFLVAGGEFIGEGETPVYKWGNKGRGARTRLPAGSQRISDIHALPDGSVVYSTGEPSIGLYDLSDRRIWLREPDIADFREGFDTFRISDDGAIVEFPYLKGGRRIARFLLSDVLGGMLSADTTDAALRPPNHEEPPGLSITDWRNNDYPKLNGKVLPLDEHEASLSYAIAPDHTHALIGTAWALRLYDKSGTLKWQTPLAQMAWMVNISGNGRWALAALSDGTIRWYSMDRGNEILAFFPHSNGNDWVVWVPSGYYTSSDTGDQYVGWHLNRDKNKSADFYRAVQLERVLYRPDLVQEYIGRMHRGEPDLRVQSDDRFDIKNLRSIAPPRIYVDAIEPNRASTASPQATVNFSVKASELPMQDYTIFVNNIPVTRARERKLAKQEARGFSREVTLDLHNDKNVIRVEVSNGKAMGVAERYYSLPDGAKITPLQAGDLYVLAVGVNHFPQLDNGWQLSYAVNDAEGVERSFKEVGTGYYREIFTKILSDNGVDKPDKRTIKASLQFIQAARAQDTVIMFLSSHGIGDPEQSYYFVPRDALLRDVQQIKAGQPGGERSLIGWETFFEGLRNTAGRRLLIVDSCKAKSIEGRSGAQWLKKRSASARFALMASSKGSEKSLEGGQFGDGHGIFTYAVLQGLETACDGNCTGTVTLSQLFDFVRPMVEEQRVPEAGQQTPQLSAPEELQDMVLGRPTTSWMEEVRQFWGDLREAWKGE